MNVPVVNPNTFRTAPPTVSVIIPNYNHARFLERRVSTVLAQTFGDFEVLFLDDASIDDSREMVSRFTRDPRIRVETNAINSGNPFKQWNRGVRFARGKYIWIAESDDAADPLFLERTVAILDGQPNVGLAYCQSKVVDEDNRVLGVVNNHKFQDANHWQEDYVNGGKDECCRFLVHMNTIPNASAVLFRRELYEQAGYVNEAFRFCGDWWMWVRILLMSDVAYIADSLNEFRHHTGSVSSRRGTSQTKFLEHLWIVSEILRRADITRNQKAAASITIASDWSWLLLVNLEKLSWEKNAKLFFTAWRIDPHIPLRVARTLLRHKLLKPGTP